ncbi:hypothetical protein K7W03_02485 [Sphingobium sp. PNB]|uniref:nucleotide disphospho-sugar-binding domain-containing protein n=1 Tax=Sphingobium sp. PNB TaxID=863934 RepID=UPI001CA3BBCD|nr:nucleotide disphospho-sugar-binding domain-containing protein [Sphingobium sp. PNB]MCB4858458.1 hypothetical protein [Sphingobium sp. PNB]
MRIIIAATPAADFVEPLLGLARLFCRYGHEAVILTGPEFVDRVRETGTAFAALPVEAGVRIPTLNERALPRLDPAANDISLRLIAALPGQYHALAALIAAFQPDCIVTDQMFLGAVPIMLSPPANRPFVAACGMTLLTWPGESARSGDVYRQPSEGVARFNRPTPARGARLRSAQLEFDRQLRALGVEPQGSPLTVAARCADIYWQAGLPEFDHASTRLPDHIRHIGLWPALPTRLELPAWAERLQDGRRLVLVTPGSGASDHVRQLLLPTMRALAHRKDLVVIGSTGGQDLSGTQLPDNARIADDLPVQWILPHTHALVTSDEYGATLRALACGVPTVIAGSDGAHPTVATAVARAGAGIDLRTPFPSQAELRAALDALLAAGSPQRRAAHAIASRFTRYDACEIILTGLEEQHQKLCRAA